MTRGIFRRSAGVKACREFKEKLDSGHYEEPLSGEPVLVTASVFKVDIYRYYFHSNVLKKVLYAQQSCIYLIKNTVIM